MKYVALWAGLNFLFHLIWEILQLRLYTLWNDPDRPYVAWAVLHCTLGDVIIATAAFVLAAGLFRRADWPMLHPVSGTMTVAVLATMYTVWSEWYNVYRVGSWAYAPGMPTLSGIGVTPMLQWILLPPATVFAFRALSGVAAAARIR